MHVFDSIESLRSQLGQHLGVSSWRPVEQPAVDTFADLTDDHQWIHVDVERARSSDLGGTVAHGFLTLGLVPSLAEEVFRWAGWSMTLNYGLDKVRFPAPLPVGSRIRGSFVLADVTETKNGYLMQVDATVEVEGGAKPTCAARWLVALVP